MREGHRWQRKPPPGSRINRRHPYCRGLIAAFLANEGAGDPFNLITRRRGSRSGSVWGVGRRGRQIVHDTTTDRTTLINAAAIPTDQITIILGYRKTDTTNRASGAFGIADAGADIGARCGVHLPYSDGTVYWDFGNYLFTGVNRITAAGLTFGDDVWAFTQGPRGGEIWQNGSLKAGPGTPGATRSASTADFVLGEHGAEASDLAAYSFIYAYNRQLSASEIKSLSRDPWQIVLTPEAAAWLHIQEAGGGEELLAEFTETLTYSDARAVSLTRVLSEALSYAEARALGIDRAIAESLTLTDSRTLGIVRILADALTLADELASALNSDGQALLAELSEVITLSDTRALGIGRALAESLFLSDARALSLLRSLSETLSLTDTRTLSALRALSESILLSDALSRAADYVLGISETLTLADTAARTAAFTRSFAEALGISDDAALMVLAATALVMRGRRLDTAMSGKRLETGMKGRRLEN